MRRWWGVLRLLNPKVPSHHHWLLSLGSPHTCVSLCLMKWIHHLLLSWTLVDTCSLGKYTGGGLGGWGTPDWAACPSSTSLISTKWRSLDFSWAIVLWHIDLRELPGQNGYDWGLAFGHDSGSEFHQTLFLSCPYEFKSFQGLHSALKLRSHEVATSQVLGTNRACLPALIPVFILYKMLFLWYIVFSSSWKITYLYKLIIYYCVGVNLYGSKQCYH